MHLLAAGLGPDTVASLLAFRTLFALALQLPQQAVEQPHTPAQLLLVPADLARPYLADPAPQVGLGDLQSSGERGDGVVRLNVLAVRRGEEVGEHRLRVFAGPEPD